MLRPGGLDMRRRNQDEDRRSGDGTGGTEQAEGRATVVMLTEFLAQREAEAARAGANHPSRRGRRAHPSIPLQAPPVHDDVEPAGVTTIGASTTSAVIRAPREEAPAETEVAHPTPEAEAAPPAAALPTDTGTETGDTLRDALTYELSYDTELDAPVAPEIEPEETLAPAGPTGTAVPTPHPVASQPEIPETARWRASNGPRVFAGGLLVAACLGATALAFRFEASRNADDFVSLAIGCGIVVALWAIMIASAPQAVTLRGSLLTLHHRGGYERFDLADGLQPVDLVGDPRSSQWALLLHRPDCSSVVLRRRDVDAVALDPIVRHYRDIAEHRNAEREARFSR